jgi:hypothetical protein
MRGLGVDIAEAMIRLSAVDMDVKLPASTGHIRTLQQKGAGRSRPREEKAREAQLLPKR